MFSTIYIRFGHCTDDRVVSLAAWLHTSSTAVACWRKSLLEFHESSQSYPVNALRLTELSLRFLHIQSRSWGQMSHHEESGAVAVVRRIDQLGGMLICE
jgi:hypothetical protein